MADFRIRDFFHVGGRRNGKKAKLEKVRERQIHEQEAGEVRQRRSIADALRDEFGDAVYDRANSPSTQMAVALNAKNGPTYAGTVAKATIARRRAANKRARVARRAARR